MNKVDISVIGAGSWGTALAMVLADNDHKVTLWTRNSEHANSMQKNRHNQKYIKGNFSNNIIISSNLEEAVKNKKYILLVTPSHSLEDLCPKINEYLDEDAYLIHAIKGIIPDSLMRVSQVINDKMPKLKADNLAVLSGPSHAEEVADRKPTTVLIASDNILTAQIWQKHFNNENFRVYTNTDVIGTELGGALKNIIAIGAGISDGLGFGDNAKAALMTRGLAEIIRLGVGMGAELSTFYGLAGIGDLIVTCTSVHSRNYKAGRLIGEGQAVTEALDNVHMVVEGIRTIEAAHSLAEREKINMPITDQLYQIIYKGQNPLAAVKELMGRVTKEEF